MKASASQNSSVDPLEEQASRLRSEGKTAATLKKLDELMTTQCRGMRYSRFPDQILNSLR